MTVRVAHTTAAAKTAEAAVSSGESFGAGDEPDTRRV